MDTLHIPTAYPRGDMCCPGSRVAHPGGTSHRP